jgi:hypothetical protein
MNRIRFFALAAMVVSGCVNAQGVGLSAGVSSLGLGLDLSKELADGWTGRLGLNSYKYSKSLTESGIDYTADFKWASAHALADWYPMRGTFRTSFGLVYNNNKFTMTGKPSGGSYTINGQIYTTAEIGSLTGEVTFNRSAPYLGVGWGNPVAAGKTWGFVADLGVLYQGSPKPKLTATCGTNQTLCAQLPVDTAAQQSKLNSDLNSFKWYPVFSVGASYRF